VQLEYSTDYLYPIPLFCLKRVDYISRWECIVSSLSNLYSLGATVMPHNLYLHSHIVKATAATPSVEDYTSTNDTAYTSLSPHPATSSIPPPSLRERLKYASLDSIFSLILASFVNASILIVAAASFYTPPNSSIPPTNSTIVPDVKVVADLLDAHALLITHLGPAAGVLFGVGLLMSGQSSTITGTLAGQVVMEGFLGEDFKMPPWMRRLVTRLSAIVPSMIAAVWFGEQGMNELLVFSQVVLSLQLPFAVWPLVYFTSSKEFMRTPGATREHEDDGDGDCDFVDGGTKPTKITRRSITSNTSDSEIEEFDMTVFREGSSPSSDSHRRGSVTVEEGETSIEHDLRQFDEDLEVVTYENSRGLMYVSVIVASLITFFNAVLFVQLLRGQV
jgi:Mn2+/Fe2+ NRAMP family transporter